MGLIHLKAAGEVKGDFKYLAEKLLSVKFSFTEMEKYSKTARKGLFFFFLCVQPENSIWITTVMTEELSF